MARLWLIRHAQASFAAKNYDNLSPLGHQQSQLLGNYFSTLYQPERLVCGLMQRHRQTVEGINLGFGNKLSVDYQAGFNEFAHVDVLAVYHPPWKNHGAIVSDLAARDNPHRYFQQQFKAAVARWISGEHDDDYRESWPQFRQRVCGAFERLQQQALDDGLRHLVVVSSGGPISIMAGELLGLSPTKIFELNAVMVNTSITEVLFRSSGYGSIESSLSFFNNFTYLQQHNTEWVTYR